MAAPNGGRKIRLEIQYGGEKESIQHAVLYYPLVDQEVQYYANS